VLPPKVLYYKGQAALIVIILVLLCAGNMMSFKDWVLSQLITKSVASSRPLLASDNFLSEEHPDQGFDHPGNCPSCTMINNSPLISCYFIGIMAAC